MPRTRRVARRSNAPRPETVTVQEDPAGTKAEYIRVDSIYDDEKATWVLRDTAPYEPKPGDDVSRSSHAFGIRLTYD